MENAYGIGVKNRYELFYDEDVDPLEIIRQQEEEKEKRKTDKSNPKDKSKNIKAKKVVPATVVTKKAKDGPEVNITKPSENTEAFNKPRSRPFTDRTGRNPRVFDESKSLEERKNFRNREEHGPPSTENRERDSEMRRGRGGFRGRGRGRGRSGFFNSFENRPPRREFDRYSGSDRTGFRSFEKKDGGESNNWSDMKNEINTRKKETESTWMDEPTESSKGKQNESNWGEIQEEPKSAIIKDEGNDVSNAEAKENLDSSDHIDENAKEMTLDEWKREQEAKRAVPKYNLRKPGEGEDGNQWKRGYVLKKKAKEGGGDDDDEDEEEDDDISRRGRHRQLVDIQINFNDSRRGRGGRGRGIRGIGPRIERSSTGTKDVQPREERREPVVPPNVGGRNFRGGMRFNKSGQQSAPKVDDWNDFPSLVTA